MDIAFVNASCTKNMAETKLRFLCTRRHWTWTISLQSSQTCAHIRTQHSWMLEVQTLPGQDSCEGCHLWCAPMLCARQRLLQWLACCQQQIMSIQIVNSVVCYVIIYVYKLITFRPYCLFGLLLYAQISGCRQNVFVLLLLIVGNTDRGSGGGIRQSKV